MWCVLLVLFISIFIFLFVLFFGSKIGGLGLAYAAGVGLFFITIVMGIPPGNIPINVVFIILPIVGAVAALELAGGLDYMVHIAEKTLRRNPKHINIIAPIITYILTVLVGTGHAVYSLMPIIVEVAQKNNIRPVTPLSTAVVASQIGITASPIAAAVVAFCGIINNFNISLPTLLMITFPSGLLAVILVGILQSFRKQDLSKDKNYLQLISQNELLKPVNTKKVIKKGAKVSVILFLSAIAFIVLLLSLPSLKPAKVSSAQLIMVVMLSIGYIIIVYSKSNIANIVNQKTFKAGITAAFCIIGLAWFGDTLISYYKSDISSLAKDVLVSYPWLFFVVTFIVAIFLYSQATTVTTIMPLAVALTLSPVTIVSSFVAVNALFIIPTYPPVIAATQLDYTGTTKIGKYIFNHPFLLPCVLMILIAVVIEYVLASLVL